MEAGWMRSKLSLRRLGKACFLFGGAVDGEYV